MKRKYSVAGFEGSTGPNKPPGDNLVFFLIVGWFYRGGVVSGRGGFFPWGDISEESGILL